MNKSISKKMKVKINKLFLNMTLKYDKQSEKIVARRFTRYYDFNSVSEKIIIKLILKKYTIKFVN